MMNDDQIRTRLTQLEDNIKQEMELLHEYEVALRYEDKPRRIAKYRREIERQRESWTRYQREYDELLKLATGDSQNQVRAVESQLKAMETELDRVQKIPSIWNIPHLRNPNFTGRVALLDNLHKALTSGQYAAFTQAVTGLGGKGKTQLALEYAYRHKENYDVLWWIRSEEPASLASDYANLAVKLDLPEKNSAEQDVIIEAVRIWLEQNEKWLLIFDNAHDPKDVRDYLPRTNSGRVIITSRNPNWGGTARTIPVDVFSRDESVEFLCTRTGQEDKEAAYALAEALGDLPLALEQAGAYIEETPGINLEGYLNLFKTKHDELWKYEQPPSDYPDTVATTWNLAMKIVRDKSQAGADLLNLCAFLAPENIPLTLLSDEKEHLPEPLASVVDDPLKMGQATKPLQRYSLISVEDGALSIHRLVQAVTRDQLSDNNRKMWAEAAVRMVNDSFPPNSDDVRTWGECSILFPHALAATEHAEKLEVAPEATGRLLNHVGGYLWTRAELTAARKLYERALEIDEKAYGPNHTSVATMANNLGNVLQDLGKLEEAKKLYERALEIDEKTYGPNHTSVATDVNNLGNVLQDMGKLEEAKRLYERALEINEKVLGKDHPNTIIVRKNLGAI